MLESSSPLVTTGLLTQGAGFCRFCTGGSSCSYRDWSLGAMELEAVVWLAILALLLGAQGGLKARGSAGDSPMFSSQGQLAPSPFQNHQRKRCMQPSCRTCGQADLFPVPTVPLFSLGQDELQPGTSCAHHSLLLLPWGGMATGLGISKAPQGSSTMCSSRSVQLLPETCNGKEAVVVLEKTSVHPAHRSSQKELPADDAVWMCLV